MFWDIDDQSDVTVWYPKHGPTYSGWHTVCQNSDRSIYPMGYKMTLCCVHCVFIIQCTVHIKHYSRHAIDTHSTSLVPRKGNPLQLRQNERDRLSNHQHLDCLFNRFRCGSKKTSKLSLTGLLRGIHRWPANSSQKGTVTRKMFSFDEIIMLPVCGRLVFSLMLVWTSSWENSQVPCDLIWQDMTPHVTSPECTVTHLV